ncbi:MAG: hypothetical protein ACOC9W_01300 [Persicimonas sp.]
MSRRACVLAALIPVVVAAGCGYLDDDILLSDEAFEASFEGKGEAEAITTAGRGHMTGCGLHHGHGTHIHFGDEPIVIRASAPSEESAPISSGESRRLDADHRAARGRSAWLYRDEEDDADQPGLSTGLETWGQYLEAVLDQRQGGGSRN